MDKFYKINLDSEYYLLPVLNTDGDLFFYKFKDNIAISKIDIDINKDNKLVIEEISIDNIIFDEKKCLDEIKNSHEILNSIKNNKLKLYTKPNTLEDKTYKEMVKDIIKGRDKDEDADDEENYDPERYYEENYELELDNLENSDEYFYENLYEEEYCIFQSIDEKNKKNVLLQKCEDDDKLVALYDVLIYTGNDKNKYMMFRSVLKNTDPFYRIIINEYNEIVFKIIAEKVIKYKFVVGETLELVEI